MDAINRTLVAALLIAIPSITFFLEAYLEVIVIALKNGSLKDYDSLNKKEHSRSAMFATAILSPFIGVAVLFHFYWLIPAILVNRRLVFDPMLKIMRKRRLQAYEGTGPVDRAFSRLFGTNGALWEIACEFAFTLILYFIAIN